MNRSNPTSVAAEAWNIRLVAQTNLNGHGDCMHVNVQDGFAYVGHMGGDRVGTSVVDVSNPESPEVVCQLETPLGTHSHKVQVVGDLMVVNHEKNFLEPSATEWSAGLKTYDISKPWSPEELGFLPMSGKGVHRVTFDGLPYAYMSGSDEEYSDQFLIIADLGNPAQPKEVSRWWAPGMHTGAGELPDWPPYRRYAHHHARIRANRAYATWWDAGLYILDISDISKPKEISRLNFGEDVSGCTHTALPVPGRDLLIVVDEAMSPVGAHGQLNGISMKSRLAPKHIRVIDISDESNPKVVSTFPIPEGNFSDRPGRFGPHNLHEMRPGTFQSSRTTHVTYFNAGLRVYDISDELNPVEIAYFVPPAATGAESIQLNDITVAADGLIYVTDRAGGGLYILEPEIDFP